MPRDKHALTKCLEIETLQCFCLCVIPPARHLASTLLSFMTLQRCLVVWMWYGKELNHMTSSSLPKHFNCDWLQIHFQSPSQCGLNECAFDAHQVDLLVNVNEVNSSAMWMGLYSHVIPCLTPVCTTGTLLVAFNILQSKHNIRHDYHSEKLVIIGLAWPPPNLLLHVLCIILIWKFVMHKSFEPFLVYPSHVCYLQCCVCVCNFWHLKNEMLKHHASCTIEESFASRVAPAVSWVDRMPGLRRRTFRTYLQVTHETTPFMLKQCNA